VFWLLMVVTAARFVGMGVVTLHLVGYLQGHGFSPRAASTALGLGLAASLPGRAISGWLADRIASRWMLGLCLIFQALSLLPVMLATGDIHLYLYAALWGMGLGSEPLIGSIRADYFGQKNFGAISGYFTWPHVAASPVRCRRCRPRRSGSYLAVRRATSPFGGAAVVAMPGSPDTDEPFGGSSVAVMADAVRFAECGSTGRRSAECGMSPFEPLSDVANSYGIPPRSCSEPCARGGAWRGEALVGLQMDQVRRAAAQRQSDDPNPRATTEAQALARTARAIQHSRPPPHRTAMAATTLARCRR
jgi:hypothetical protein